MKTMHTTYQIRARLTRGKHRRLDSAFGACARLYNAALENWRTAYKTTRYWRGRANAVSPTLYDQNRELTGVRADDPTYGAMSVQVGRGALLRLDRARNAFFARVKKGERKVGFPRFKAARRWNSIEIPQPTAGMIKADGRGGYAVRIKGLPALKIKPKRELPDPKTLKTIVIKRTQTGVTVNLIYAVEFEPLPATGKIAGVDMGVTTRFALSNGANYPRAQVSDHAELQRRIARCKLGSNNQRKLYSQLARAKHRDALRRRNETHRITTEIIRDHDLTAIENLQPKRMTSSAAGTVEKPGRGVSAKRGLNRSIQEQAWGMARAQLEYKAARYGRELIAVNPRHTSQTCSVCGTVDAQARRGKQYACGRCGARMDADTNAARVILARGLRMNAGGESPRGESRER